MKSGTCFHFGFFSVILVTCVVTGTGVVIDCYSTTEDEYVGLQQTTNNGTPCIRWDSYDNKVYINYQFRDATVSDAANSCRAVRENDLWCWTSYRNDWNTCGIEKCVNNGISKCDKLKIERPALLGKNVTFTFRPDSHYPDAILEWQRAAQVKGNPWYTRPLTYKFTQYNDNGTYYMVLTDSVLADDEAHYRIHYYNESMHCWMEAGKLKLDVPPPDIKLEIITDSAEPLRMYAVCTLDNSNSSCIVNFTATNEIIGSETISRNMSLLHGLWMIEYVVNLNVSKEDNGTDVTCAAECADFKYRVLRGSKTIQLPYRPDIKFNISGAMLDITKGERAHVKCTADSYPASNISWIEKTDKEDKKKKQCDYGQECVLDVNADVVSKQYFVCEIRYLQLSDNKSLIVNIYKSRKQRHMFNIGNVTFIGIIVGICSALVVIVAVMVFVIRNKRNNDQAKHKIDKPSQERNGLPPRENEHAAPGNDVGLADDLLDVIYSQPVKKKKVAAVCDDVYAEVDKTSKKTQLVKCSATEGKRSEDGQLMYVDLEFNADGKMPKQPSVKRRDSPTDYVAIDFAKTAAYVAEENEAIEMDSIYANQ